MRVCLCERGKFATQALFSVQVMALGSTNREVNMTAGEVLLVGDNAINSCIITSASKMASKEHKQTTKLLLLNLPAFLLLNTKKHKPSSESNSIYVPQAQQNSLQSALHRAAKYIPGTVVLSCRPECDNASKQA